MTDEIENLIEEFLSQGLLTYALRPDGLMEITAPDAENNDGLKKDVEALYNAVRVRDESTRLEIDSRVCRFVRDVADKSRENFEIIQLSDSISMEELISALQTANNLISHKLSDINLAAEKSVQQIEELTEITRFHYGQRTDDVEVIAATLKSLITEAEKGF
ncbi:LAMI_0D05754g1_1 [Lachancea mirantina]|uniref:LAMI_0D05754g1_1 n=1 Tax=Lachancea mirantina TaxID=1230905 RepID=A0A1G4JB96_9SACH|nr:LAMI_0D05754g1_1 [Lachancea mirantina]